MFSIASLTFSAFGKSSASKIEFKGIAGVSIEPTIEIAASKNLKLSRCNLPAKPKVKADSID
jgi:hypothetical protein